jgi:hypothetical protein
MAHFVKPLKPNPADKFSGKGDGSLSAMTITKGTGPHYVIVWGGDSKGKELVVVAFNNAGKRFAEVTRVPGKAEAGHGIDPDGDHLWFLIYRITPISEGTGTLTAVNAAGMPFARISLVISPDQGIKVEQTLPEAFMSDTKSSVHPGSVAAFSNPLIAKKSKLLPGSATATAAELRFRIEKNGAVFWIGACVPEGTADFTRAYVFFHPDVMSPKDSSSYPSFTGPWPGVSRYVFGQGIQLAAVRKMVLLVPFMTNESGANSATTNVFADRGLATLNEIMTGCQVAAGLGSNDVKLQRLGLSSYSSGINHLARFADVLGGSGLIKEMLDLDSGYMRTKHRGMPNIKGAITFAVSQNPPQTPTRNWLTLGADAWELISDFGPAKDPRGLIKGDNIHGKIGNLMFQSMMLRSVVK